LDDIRGKDRMGPGGLFWAVPAGWGMEQYPKTEKQQFLPEHSQIINMTETVMGK